MAGLRSLVETQQFAAAKTKALQTLDDVKAFDDLMFGIDYVLCNDPGRYGEVSGTNGVRLFKTRPFNKLPAFRVWYRFDEQKVYLLYLEAEQ